MSAHKCPNCKELDFFWSNDEEVSLLTIWGCGTCGYDSLEDEKKESNCPDCDYAHRLFMIEPPFKYWWCTKCERKTMEE